LNKETPKETIPKPVLPPVPRSVQWLRGALAICLLLIMGGAVLVFFYWSKTAEAKIEIRALEQRYDSLLQTLPKAGNLPEG
jgi:hypothetical protein